MRFKLEMFRRLKTSHHVVGAFLFTGALSHVILHQFCLASNASDPVVLTFRIGASVGREGPCAPLYNQTVQGYRYFFSWFERQPPNVVSDITGKKYILRLQFTLVQHDCTEPGRTAALASLINGRPPDPATGDPGQPAIHLLLGGNGENALGDSLQADSASRVLVHCCTARDSVYLLDLPHVYGLFTPASMYTGAILRTMAFSGIKQVAVLYNMDMPLHMQLCEGAVRQIPPLRKLQPGFDVIRVLNYTTMDTRRPDFWQEMAMSVIGSKADALVACDEMVRTSQLVRQLQSRGHKLAALWLSSYGNVEDFVSYMGDTSQYALTTVQWMPSMPYADPIFGTAQSYANAFEEETGVTPSYFSAGATAGAFVLLTGLQQALQSCDLSRLLAAAAADDSEDDATDVASRFLWREGALSCRSVQGIGGVKYGNVSGQLMLRTALSSMHMETFFGPVGFNNYRQNVYHPPAVVQVLGNRLAVVIPLDLAEQRLVMPIPGSEPEEGAWTNRTFRIGIIVLLCGLGCITVGLMMVVAHRWLRPRLSLSMEVEVDPTQMEVDIAPIRNVDGSFEPGEGVYRGTRVKLEVAAELVARVGGLAPSAAAGGATSTALLYKTPPLVMSAIPNLSKPSPGGAQHDTSLRELLAPGSRKPTAESLEESSASPTRSPPSGQTFSSLSRRARKQYSSLVWRAVRLQHPHICPILGIVWEWPGLAEGGGSVPVVLRQWYELGDLAALIENETVPLPLMTKTSIAQGIAEGLAYLHAQEPPILAGPLKAARIIIDKNFNPLIFLRLTNLDPMYGTESATANPAGNNFFLGRAPTGRTTGTSLPPRSSRPSVLGTAPIASGAVEDAGTDRTTPAAQSQQLPTLTVVNDASMGGATATNVPATGSPRATSAGGDCEANSMTLGISGSGCSRVANTAARPAPAESMPPPLPLLRQLSTLSETPASGKLYGISGNYCRTKEDDVLEFGRLLGAIFVSAALGSNSGNLTSRPTTNSVEPTLYDPAGVTLPAASSAAVGGADGAAMNSSSSQFQRQSTADCDWLDEAPTSQLPVPSGEQPGSPTSPLHPPSTPNHISNNTPPPLQPQPQQSAPQRRKTKTQQQQQLQQQHHQVLLYQQLQRQRDDAAMLAALEELSPDLAELARSCLDPDPTQRPSFVAIAAMLDKRIKGTLSGGIGLVALTRSGVGVGMGAAGGIPSASPRPTLMGARRASRSTPSVTAVSRATGDGGGGAVEVARRRSLAASSGGTAGGPVVPAAGLKQTLSMRRSASFRVADPALANTLSGQEMGTSFRRLMTTPDDLLFDLFPPKVARALCAGETVQPERFECVSIFFSDVVGYTDLCAQLQPHEVMDLMHRLYSQFDAIIQALKLFKVETVGDAYLAVGNLRWPQADSHARLTACFAFAAIAAANALPIHPERLDLGTVRIRVGLHAGPVVGSVVGTLNRRYCLFGDAVNTAARMEHNSEANRVHVSGVFAGLVGEQWPGLKVASRGVRHIKGKGPMETFWIELPEAGPYSAPPTLHDILTSCTNATTIGNCSPTGSVPVMATAATIATAGTAATPGPAVAVSLAAAGPRASLQLQQWRVRVDRHGSGEVLVPPRRRSVGELKERDGGMAVAAAAAGPEGDYMV